ncbi:MAG TPA: phospholipid methyltransferase [Azospirillaceae bacterium]|nr:phospholipid methyltransferase [Azospirillaceae bacterium]
MPHDRVEATADAKVSSSQNPVWLFFKRWMANPLSMASITPSAPSLARIIARNIRREPDEIVVEYGGGTGPITRALLEAGVPPSRLYVFEIDPELHAFLSAQFPDVNVILGDVRRVRDYLPEQFHGKVGTVVCGIPMILIPVEAQKTIVEEIFKIMPEGRRFLAYTYSAASPMKTEPLGIEGKRIGFTLANIPPASVWAYTKRK